MFKDKGGKIIENKPLVEVKIVSASINMVNVHVTTTCNKGNEEHLFKDQKSRKNKTTTYWEAKEKLKKFMLETNACNYHSLGSIFTLTK
jgi:hypothetical protein